MSSPTFLNVHFPQVSILAQDIAVVMMFGAKSNRTCGEIGSAVIILCLFLLQPLFRICSSAISHLKENFLETLFSPQLKRIELKTRSLKEADVNPRCSECPAYFNIWLFDISTIVLIIFTTIVCIFTSVFNAMRQLLGQSHCPGLPMGLPIPQINCPLLARCSLARRPNAHGKCPRCDHYSTDQNLKLNHQISNSITHRTN